MNVIGIYKIINTFNGKYYVGSSNDIYSRWADHRKMLRGNRHDNNHLQNAWNKYKKDSFVFSIIEKTDEINLLLVEQKYLDIAKTEMDSCYNLSFIAGKIEMTDLIKEKIRKSNKGKTVNEETRKKISNSVKKLCSQPGYINPMFRFDVRKKYLEIINTPEIKEKRRSAILLGWKKRKERMLCK